MRDIGSIANELDANVFRDFLFMRGIESNIERDRQGAWAVWVQDENRLEEAERFLQEFLNNPSADKFIKVSDEADSRRAKIEKEEKAAVRNLRTREDVFAAYGFSGIGIITIILIILSVAVTLISSFGGNVSVKQALSIAQTHIAPGRGEFYFRNLMEVREGQVWRLITPLFLHFGIMHIVFNMMWLCDLGSMIERIRGSLFIAIFVLVTGALSNISEFYMSGPGFGGMSGVVYGLLGYVWMQSRFNPWSGFVLHSLTVQMMLVWFVLCLSGLIGNIANTTHAVGLAIGVVWGYVDARRQTSE